MLLDRECSEIQALLHFLYQKVPHWNEEFAVEIYMEMWWLYKQFVASYGTDNIETQRLGDALELFNDASRKKGAVSGVKQKGMMRSLAMMVESAIDWHNKQEEARDWVEIERAVSDGHDS